MLGRPTSYKPEYCQLLIQHMEKGYSFESFAGLVGVSKQTIYDWCEANPNFLDSKKKAFEKNRLFWEEQGIDGLFSETEFDSKGKPVKSRSINSTLWIFQMKNRFKEEWREKQEIQHEGHIGTSITVVKDDGCEPVKD